MITRNDLCWCGSGLKWKKCHYPIGPTVDFAALSKEYRKRYGIILKTPEQIALIAARIVARDRDRFAE